MLCDDTTELVDTIGKELRNLNFNITNIVYSGQDCIDAIKNGAAPDLLILDISMPKVPEYEVVKQLKKLNPEIKILIFSAYNDNNVVKAMIRFGALGFMYKGDSLKGIDTIIHTIYNGGEHYPKELSFTKAEINEIKNTPVPWLEQITDREMLTIKLIAKDLLTKEVAENMGITESVSSPKKSTVNL